MYVCVARQKQVADELRQDYLYSVMRIVSINGSDLPVGSIYLANPCPKVRSFWPIPHEKLTPIGPQWATHQPVNVVQISDLLSLENLRGDRVLSKTTPTACNFARNVSNETLLVKCV